ncbi:MAG: DUF3800 domain-containing protein [Chloroflexi bacterium]|nr:DUF3800 domain-containing protein [Chloroflexota bacterium]
MHIVYYDESGDDGFPRYSSSFFILTALYFHYLNWKPMFEEIRDFRRDLKSSFGIPIKTEMHTKQFMLNKQPYRAMTLAEQQRLDIVGLFCDLIASLDVRVINIVIVKPRIVKSTYQVLDTALTYSVQRIENDLDPTKNPEQRFMIISDSGRVGKMRRTTRRIQKVNFIPSKYETHSYRRDIKALIEDPLPKDSKESYFIQLADLVSYIVHLYSIDTLNIGTYSNRLKPFITPEIVTGWMERLKPSLNLQASSRDPYGVVYYPR